MHHFRLLLLLTLFVTPIVAHESCHDVSWDCPCGGDCNCDPCECQPGNCGVATPCGFEFEPWCFKVGLNLKALNGNSRTYYIDLDGSACLKVNRDGCQFSELDIVSEVDFETTRSLQSVNKGLTKATYRQWWSEEGTIRARYKLNYDRMKNIHSRNALMLGVGYLVVNQDQIALDLVGGLAWVTTRYEESNLRRESYLFVPVGYILNWCWPNGWTLHQEFEHSMRANEASDYRTELKTELTMPIDDHYEACYESELIYLSRPATGKRGLDSENKLKIKYTF